MASARIGFGAFLPPFHPVGEDPTVALRRDLELVEWLDALDFDEVWVGEHHSGGWAIISAPEIFVAAAAERTRHIRLGTGAVSLPFHHPLLVANRFVQLDHLTRGRCMFGVGAGSLPSDAHMLGIAPADQRRMMAESLDAITHLMTSAEPRTEKTDWYELKDARLHLRPYSPEPELAIASASSPVSMRLAGRYGLSPLSFGAARPGGDPSALRTQWAAAEEEAARWGRTMRRETWRIALSVHIADSRAEAFDDVRWGARRWLFEYFRDTGGVPVSFPDVEPGQEIEVMAAGGAAIVGTVDDCVAAIDKLIESTGGFGRLLVTVQDWAPRQKQYHSFELLARHVMPRYRGSTESTSASQRWVAAHSNEFFQQSVRAARLAAAPAG